jgi:hypothetical protein
MKRLDFEFHLVLDQEAVDSNPLSPTVAWSRRGPRPPVLSVYIIPALTAGAISMLGTCPAF